MRKGYLMLVLAALVALPVKADHVKHENYIGSNDVKGWMYEYYGSWTPGQSPAGGSENENFYIGRVRPLKRFTNTATQVKKGDQRLADRKLLWWVPINQTNDGGWTSLPSYCFDSEAFSMWSYVTIHGNWTQGFLRQPGAFADACHKNGVSTGVVSSAAWAVDLHSGDKSHGQNYNALVQGGADKLLKLMTYYGIDGLGFNSEQSWGDVRSGMKTLMQNSHTKKTSYGINDRLYFAFYNLSSGLSGSGGGTEFSDFFPWANAFFLNYNWGASALSNAEDVANGKSSNIANSWDVYAGVDHQGRGVTGSGDGWKYLNTYDISLGIWGAHNKNMIYESATGDGSKPEQIQHCYMRKAEYFFTGGTQNPVNASINPVSNRLNSGTDDFFGISQLMAAKSALSWVANGYFPFISYMNLGNGKFFHNEGETTYNDEWYNLGMQDHLPTWRWWITNTYMGRQSSQVPTDTKATFTYEDAWFGGSCLKITFDAAVGRGQSRYIQLYKTQFDIDASATYTLRVRYKADGQATMSYAMSKEGSEDSPVTVDMGTMNQSSWTLLEKQLPASFNNSRIAQLGLLFQNVTKGTEILIGEVALVKNGVTYNPVTPTIDNSRTKWFKTTSHGVDFKVVWNCTPNASSAPVQKAVAAVEAVDPTSSSYCTKTGTVDGGSARYTSSVGLTGSESGSWTSSTLQSSYNKPLYFDNTSTKITVKSGETLQAAFDYNGEWMHKFVYIDLNKDGDFEDDGEAVSYTHLNGTNSNGEATVGSDISNPPSFIAPAAGEYRIRFMIDWGGDNHTPCADRSSDFTNGGLMADFVLNVTSGDGGGGTVTPPVVGPTTGTIKNDGTPIYNDEVHTWYFEIFAQQEGKDEQLVTTTTTWAGYAVDVPFDLEGDLNVRAGVRAVAPDGVTKSEIAWSDWMDASKITIVEGYSIDKPVIKPNEEFTISFDDPRHSAATYFKILKSDGTLLRQFDGVTSFTYQIAEKGLYDIEAKYRNQQGVEITETIRAMIQVSGPEVGALPEIKTLTADGNATTSSQELTGADVTFDLAYTGREASGRASKALRLQEKPFGVKVSSIKSANGNVGLNTLPFTIAFWFKPEMFIQSNAGTQMLNVRAPSDGWPASDWGWIWSTIGNDGDNYSLSFRKTSNAGTKCNTQGYTFKSGYWYHLALVIDRNSSGARKITMYMNGAPFEAINQETGNVAGFISDLYGWKEDNIIYIGGVAFDRSGFDGSIDELQIWKKALSGDEVKQAMEHFDVVPNDLIAYWDFENTPNEDGTITSTGKLNNVKGFVANSWTAADGVVDGLSNIIYPTIGAGSPFLAGILEINTVPTWKYTGAPTAKGAVTGNDQAGSTSVTYGDAGTYTATLTLKNDWGQDSETIELVVIGNTVDLEGNVIENLSVYPNPFVEALHIQFAQAGEYELEVLALDGRLVQSQSVNAEAGQISRIAINGETGTYLVRVKTQGTVVKTMKLVKQ